jgi:ABC-type transport system involved in multi-copper enzyme maturation permease subunit
MNEVLTIAESTWGRILRMKVVYFLILCALVIIGGTHNYEVLSMGEHRALMVDVSLMLNTVAAFLAILAITFEISKELKDGMASTMLTKPLGRTQYLIGKCVGSALAGMVITSLIACGYAFIYNLFFQEHISAAMIQGHLLIVLSVIPMSSLAVLMAVFVSETFSALATAIIIWFTHSSSALSSVKLIYGGVIPDFNLFNLKAQAVYTTAINWDYISMVLFWGVAFSAFALALASLAFSMKDLK